MLTLLVLLILPLVPPPLSLLVTTSPMLTSKK